MIILSIETSCDETGAAIVSKKSSDKNVKILSNVVSSSLALHSKTGGIIPDIAAREQVKLIIPVIEKALKESKKTIDDIDAIAVTNGPGLIGSLLIGVETAKTLAFVWNKKIIPVNHLLGHIYANFIDTNKSAIKSQKSEVEFPALALLVSGGHTDLILLKNHKETVWIGGTKDDAAGEAFDKIGRLLDLPYPGGPSIEKVSKSSKNSPFIFPRPMIGSKDFNFSFSGLKASVLREIIKLKNGVAKEEGIPTARNDREHWREGLLLTGPLIADIAFSTQKSIIDILVRKTIKAAIKYNVRSILLGGGVSANQTLVDKFKEEIRNSKLEIPLFVPEKWLCTDNAAMIGAWALFHYNPLSVDKINANPELYF